MSIDFYRFESYTRDKREKYVKKLLSYAKGKTTKLPKGVDESQIQFFKEHGFIRIGEISDEMLAALKPCNLDEEFVVLGVPRHKNAFRWYPILNHAIYHIEDLEYYAEDIYGIYYDNGKFDIYQRENLYIDDKLEIRTDLINTVDAQELKDYLTHL